MEKVLVTGGLGFLGTNLVEDLVKEGYEVVVQDIVPAGAAAPRLAHYGDRAKYTWKNMVDFRDEDLKDINYVIHLAGQADVPFSNLSPLHTWNLNLEVSLYLLEELRRNPHIKAVFPSTDNVYGVVPPERLPIKEDEPYNPTNQYAASKIAMEMAIKAYANQHKLPLTILRLAGFFGEHGRPNQVVQIFIDKALRGEPITIEGDGSQTRDFNYVKNVTGAIIAGMKSGKTGPYNIGGGREIPIKELAEIVVRETKSSSKIELKPWRPGEKGTRYHLDISRARADIGYSPKYTLEEGIRRTIAATRVEMEKKERLRIAEEALAKKNQKM